ncbi:hypothetical protein [Roseivirga sp.]|uniref:hypothetical protein n=1 Tax=Roseivirga sp. TaxID=1964215 RepID=UPI003B8B2DAD
MEIEDLKPAWQSLKVRNALNNGKMYQPQELMLLLETQVYRSVSQRLVGAGVMLALILFFCQGG